MAIELERVGWENGTLVSPAKVNVQGTVYDVEPEIYSGNTPLSAELLKEMEDNTENAINKLTATILYEDTTGTLGNVTLSDNAENYDYIEIYYRTTGRSGSIKVEDITNKTLTLPFTITARNTLVILAKAITISSNIITDGGEFQYMKSTNGESYSELDSIYIYKVLGYKEY